MKKLAIFGVSLVLITWFGLVVSGHVMMKNTLDHYKGVSNYISRVSLDIEGIGKKFEFLEFSQNNNVHNLFKSHLGEGFSFNPKLDNIYPKFKDAFKSKSKFMDFVNLKQLEEIETNWLSVDLNNFDHWSFADDKNFKENFKILLDVNSLSKQNISSLIPVFDLNKLRLLSAISMAKSFKNKKPNNGIKNYFLTMKLIYSLGTQDGHIVALTMLEDLLQVQEFLKVTVPQLQNNSINKIDIQRLKRLSWAWNDLIPFILIRSKDDILKSLSPSKGICPGVLRTASFMASFQDYFGAGFPLEFNLEDQIKFSKTYQGKLFDLCGFKDFKMLFTKTKAGKNPWIMGDYLGSVYSKGPEFLNHSKIPYFRGISFSVNYSFPPLVLSKLYPEK